MLFRSNCFLAFGGLNANWFTLFFDQYILLFVCSSLLFDGYLRFIPNLIRTPQDIYQPSFKSEENASIVQLSSIPLLPHGLFSIEVIIVRAQVVANVCSLATGTPVQTLHPYQKGH